MKSQRSPIVTLLILGLAVAPLACKSDTKISGTVKERESKAPAEQEAKNGDQQPITTNSVDTETVTAPNAITGALLTCATIEATDKVEVSVGCRYENANKVRIPASAIAKTHTFAYAGTLPSGIIVTQLPADASYEVIYSFSGANFASLDNLVKTIQFSVQLSGLVNGDPDKTIGGKGNDIALPPPPRWVREKSTDANGNGICDGSETCIYVGNGLMWLRDSNVPKGHVDASLTCQNLTAPFSGWYLPTTTNMKIAYEKGIWDLAEASMLNIADSQYYSNQGPIPGSTPALPNGTIFTVSYKTGNQTNVLGDDLIHFLCVRPAG